MPINAHPPSTGAEHTTRGGNRTREGGKRAIKLSSTGADLTAPTDIIVRKTRGVSKQVFTRVHGSGDSDIGMLTQLTTEPPIDSSSDPTATNAKTIVIDGNEKDTQEKTSPVDLKLFEFMADLLAPHILKAIKSIASENRISVAELISLYRCDQLGEQGEPSKPRENVSFLMAQVSEALAKGKDQKIGQFPECIKKVMATVSDSLKAIAQKRKGDLGGSKVITE